MMNSTTNTQRILGSRWDAKQAFHQGASGEWYEASAVTTAGPRSLPTEFVSGSGSIACRNILVTQRSWPGERLLANAIGIKHRHLIDVTDVHLISDTTGDGLFVQVVPCKPGEAANQLPPGAVAAQWRQIVGAVASALAHLHALGLAHGAVDLSNVFLQAGIWRLGPTLCSRRVDQVDDLKALASLITVGLRRVVTDPVDQPMLLKLGELCRVKGTTAAQVAVWAERGGPGMVAVSRSPLPPKPKIVRTATGIRVSAESVAPVVFVTCTLSRVPQSGASVPMSQLDQLGDLLGTSASGHADMATPREALAVFCAVVFDGLAVLGPHALIAAGNWNLQVSLSQDGAVIRWFWPSEITCRQVHIQVRPDRYPSCDDVDTQRLGRAQYDEQAQCVVPVPAHWQRVYVRVSRTDINATNTAHAAYGNAERIASPRMVRLSNAAGRLWRRCHPSALTPRSLIRIRRAALGGIGLVAATLAATCWLHARSGAPRADSITTSTTLPRSTLVDRPRAMPSGGSRGEHCRDTGSGINPAQPNAAKGDGGSTVGSKSPASSSSDFIAAQSPSRPKVDLAVKSPEEDGFSSFETAKAGRAASTALGLPQFIGLADAPGSLLQFKFVLAPPNALSSALDGLPKSPAASLILVPACLSTTSFENRSEIAGSSISPGSNPSSVTSLFPPQPNAAMGAPVSKQSLDVGRGASLQSRAVMLPPQVPAPHMTRIQYINVPTAAVGLTAILSTLNNNDYRRIAFKVDSAAHRTDVAQFDLGTDSQTITSRDLRILVTYSDGQTIVYHNTRPKYLRTDAPLIENLEHLGTPPALKGPAMQLVGIPAGTKSLQVFVRVPGIDSRHSAGVNVPVHGCDNVAQITQVCALPPRLGGTIGPEELRVKLTLVNRQVLTYRNYAQITVSGTRVSVFDLSSITPSVESVPEQNSLIPAIYLNRVRLGTTPPRSVTLSTAGVARR